MRKTISVTIAVIAAFILLLCIAFSAVTATAQNYSFFERQFMRLGIDASTGITVSDLSKAVQTLVNYMNGKLPSIDVQVMLGGERVSMFDLEIEHTHMKECRDLWQSLISARGIGLFAGALLLVAAYLIDIRHALTHLCRSYLIAFAVFVTFCAFWGIWAGINFNSFWTFFHRMIFPNSDSWLLPATSRMIQMLPEPFFGAVVLRCASLTAIPALLFVAASTAGLIYSDRQAQASHETESSPENAEESGELPEVEEPDLVFVHKKANMPVSRRKQLELVMDEKNELERQAALFKEEDAAAAAKKEAEEAAVKIVFEPYAPDPEPETDEDEDKDEDWEE